MNTLLAIIFCNALIFHGTPGDPSLNHVMPTTVTKTSSGYIVCKPGQSIPTVVVDTRAMLKSPHSNSMQSQGFMIDPRENIERERKFNFQDRDETCPRCHNNQFARKNCSKCNKTGKVCVRKYRNPKTREYTEKTDPKKSSFWQTWIKQHPEGMW